MTQDHRSSELEQEAPQARRRSGPGTIVIAGVFGACALGAGLGLWARPADPTREVLERPAPAAPPRPASLQIVVADEPAPIGQPLEVLPGDFAEEPAQGPDNQIVAPRRAASGLVKVDAPIAAPLVVTVIKPEPEPPAAVEPPRKPKASPAPAVRKAEAGAAKAKAARAEAEKERLAKVKLAKAAEAAKAKRLAEARAEKAEKARAARLAKLQKEKAAKARLAKAEAAKKKAEASRKLAALATAAKAAPKKLRDEARAAGRKKPAELAAARPKPKAKPVPKTRKPAPRVETAAAKPPPKRVVVPRGEGPMRVASANPCDLADPGEAAVCADPRLSARERQLQRAYRNAEAAGVPASALRRQQARWQQVRAAAARDAPWAVEDVYVARISELNDLTRDAREN